MLVHYGKKNSAARAQNAQCYIHHLSREIQGEFTLNIQFRSCLVVRFQTNGGMITNDWAMHYLNAVLDVLLHLLTHFGVFLFSFLFSPFFFLANPM